MSGLKPAQVAALRPLHNALVSRAASEAEDLRRKAEEDGLALVAAAQAQADAMLADARSQGCADAAAQAASERARARRAAQAVVLQARRAVYQELRRDARSAVSGLLSEPACHARLVGLLRRQLGDQAVIHDCADGGAHAEAPGGRRVDASIDSLVDAAAATLDLEPLWQTT